MRSKYLCKNLEVKEGRGLFSREYGTVTLEGSGQKGRTFVFPQ